MPTISQSASYWDVTQVKPLEYLKLEVKFADGVKGEVHFLPSYLTGVFEKLKDEDYFYQVYIEHGVVTWPRELDLAPDAIPLAI